MCNECHGLADAAVHDEKATGEAKNQAQELPEGMLESREIKTGNWDPHKKEWVKATGEAKNPAQEIGNWDPHKKEWV